MKLPAPRYDIGSTVYPKVAPEADNALIVTGYVIRGVGWLVYLCTDANGDEKERYDHELTNEVKWSTAATEEEA